MVRGVDIWCWQPYLTPATHPRPLLGGRTDPQYWFLSRVRCFLGLGGSVWADSFCNESEISRLKFRHPTKGIPTKKRVQADPHPRFLSRVWAILVFSCSRLVGLGWFLLKNFLREVLPKKLCSVLRKLLWKNFLRTSWDNFLKRSSS